MKDFTVSDFLAMQRALQKRHEDDWAPVAPENGRNQLLWGIGEIGEMIDVIKKYGDDAVMNDALLRRHFLEETGDVFMYLFDVLLCYGVTAEEFCGIYAEKARKNLGRDFESEHDAQYERLKNTD